MIIRDVSFRLSNYIAKELKLEDEQPVMDYGLQIFLGGFLKISSLAISSYLLGVFIPAMLIMMAASLFRIITGGPHCTDYWRCFMAVHLVFLFLGLITSKLVQSIIGFDLVTIVFTIATILLLTATYLWVPGEHKERHFSERKKKLSKLISAVVIIVTYIFAMLTSKAMFNYTIPIFLGLIWQGFTITPKGYWFMGILDKILTFKVGEVKSC